MRFGRRSYFLCRFSLLLLDDQELFIAETRGVNELDQNSITVPPEALNCIPRSPSLSSATSKFDNTRHETRARRPLKASSALLLRLPSLSNLAIAKVACGHNFVVILTGMLQYRVHSNA